VPQIFRRRHTSVLKTSRCSLSLLPLHSGQPHCTRHPLGLYTAGDRDNWGGLYQNGWVEEQIEDIDLGGLQFGVMFPSHAELEAPFPLQPLQIEVDEISQDAATHHPAMVDRLRYGAWHSLSNPEALGAAEEETLPGVHVSGSKVIPPGERPHTLG
jgi:hypothetical protein